MSLPFRESSRTLPGSSPRRALLPQRAPSCFHSQEKRDQWVGIGRVVASIGATRGGHPPVAGTPHLAS